MRCGYFTMPLHPPGSNPSRTIADDLEQLVALERLGFEEAWIGEHFTSIWENIPCPDLFIAQALAMTRTMKLGTGVSCLPNHHPLMLAQRIAQLDHMAKGRLYWGVGSGGFPGDFELFGIDAQGGEQRRVTREVLDVVLNLWSDPKPGVYKSKHWEFRVPDPQEDIGLELHLRPYQRPHPPIGVAGLSPKSETLVMAGERGYIPMSINIVPSRILSSHWEVVEASAKAVGHPTDRGTWRIARDVYVADTTARARREVLEGTLARDWRQYFLPLLRKVGMLGLTKVDPDMPDDRVTPEYLLDNIWVVGDPDEVTRKLQKLKQDVGGFGGILLIGHEWQPHDVWLRSMTMFHERVLPNL
jgi:alkanesulfonate monooxygenase SsuD/methylene tetrahydromethanopterin reductase-like flavin-dependent oxidoreductase (luciferase family)